jgi:hypothetical protein
MKKIYSYVINLNDYRKFEDSNTIDADKLELKLIELANLGFNITIQFENILILEKFEY